MTTRKDAVMTTWKDRDYMIFKKMILNLFDGEGGATAGAPTNGGEPTAEPSIGFTSRRQAAAERERMAKAAMRGATPTVATPKAEATKTEPTTAHTKTEEPKAEAVQPKSYAEQHDEMMKDPEYRKFFSEKAQDIFNSKYKNYKTIKSNFEAIQPILSTLAEKYGVDANDLGAIAKAFENDNEIYEALGEKSGLSGEQFKAMNSLRQTATRERAMREEIEARYKTEQTAQKLQAEAVTVQQLYPEFDFKATISNPQIREMLKAGVSLKAAYEAVNMDHILEMRTKAAEKKVTDNIQARATRPVEGGASAQTGNIVQNRAASLTRQDREALAKRAIRGENITLK